MVEHVGPEIILRQNQSELLFLTGRCLQFLMPNNAINNVDFGPNIPEGVDELVAQQIENILAPVRVRILQWNWGFIPPHTKLEKHIYVRVKQNHALLPDLISYLRHLRILLPLHQNNEYIGLCPWSTNTTTGKTLYFPLDARVITQFIIPRLEAAGVLTFEQQAQLQIQGLRQHHPNRLQWNQVSLK